jgi:3-oxoacyl-[acyl-carrier protein] reductase
MLKRVAIITGASRGIGYGIAHYLAKKNYHLLLIARNRAHLEQAAQTLRQEVSDANVCIRTAALDVSHDEAVKSTVEMFINEMGKVDLLVNNAGYVKRGSSALSLEEFNRMLDVNLRGAFHLVHTVAPFMKQAGEGRIIQIASYSGKVARKLMGGYAASKFGLLGLNESLYKELAEYGIYVTAICPNLVATEMTSDVEMDPKDMLEVEDVVKTVNYLLSLSKAVSVKEVVLQCRKKVLEEK